MKRSRLIAGMAAVVAVSAAVAVSPVQAAPIPGGERLSRPDNPVYLATYAAGDSFGGLTSLGCPFVQHDYGENAYGTTLTANIKGWTGPIDQVTFDYQVLLRAHVTGTVEDVAGNAYAVNGNFTDRSTRNLFGSFDLVFDGAGKVNRVGPAGVVVGRAEFRFVTAPQSFELISRASSSAPSLREQETSTS
jgi:hypothetical protein